MEYISRRLPEYKARCGDHLKEVTRVQGLYYGDGLKEVARVLGSSHGDHLKEVA